MKVQLRSDEVSDVLTRDGVTVVLVRGRLVRLSPLAAMIVTLAEDLIGDDELARELAIHFGSPEHGTALEATKDAVTDLVRLGVLRRSG